VELALSLSEVTLRYKVNHEEVMQKVWRLARATIGMGLLWAVGGIFVGGLIELIDNIVPGGFARQVDMWPQTLALLGFVTGVVFAGVLAIAGRRHRFDQLSLSRFTAWGALGGAALGALGMSKGAPALFLAITTAVSAVGAAGSLAIARRAERRALTAGDA
jgi:hypothetical protein